MSTEPSEIELLRVGNKLPVPTRDDQVIIELRRLGERLEPSESPASRRKRLLLITARRHLQGEDSLAEPPIEEATNEQQEYYSKASEELFKVRQDITTHSREASTTRLANQRHQAQAVSLYNIDQLRSQVVEKESQIASIKSLECKGIESGFSRPVSGITFAEDALYAGDWSGKIFNMDYKQVEIVSQKQEHAGKVCLSSWRHGLISGGLEGDIHVADGRVLKSSHRVAHVDGHPTMDLVAGAYFDKTWKLWDTNGTLLLSQSGHSREVYATKFHPDGSLMASAGLDGRAIIWDIRSGESVMTLDEHVREIYAMDWGSDGHTLATGGADNNLIIWDIRNKINRMIPAHTNMVSCLKYVGSTVISGSYDKTVKVWNPKTGSLINSKVLDEKVMSLDYYNGTLAAGKWDRTVDVWGPA